MPEIINSLFGRARNDMSPSGEPTEIDNTPAAAVAVEPVDPQAIDVEQDEPETVAPTGDATEDVAEDFDDDVEDDDVESPADADAEKASDDTADAVESDDDADDQADEDEADEATAEVDADEADDEDGAVAEEDEPVAAESDDAPAVAETDEVDADETEPVAEAAETRPAAGARGNTTLGDGVVAKIVNLVAAKTDGVHGLDSEGTSVAVDDDIATIKVSLVVEYGHPIKALAEQIRTNVIDAVEQFLGLDVAAVDVHVSDIHQPDAD